MRHERTIQIPKDKVQEIQQFLDGPGQGTCKVEYTYSTDFGNGIEVDIKVCDAESDSTPFIDPVIFDHGQEIFPLEVRGTLLGEYAFEVISDWFVVTVQEE